MEYLKVDTDIVNAYNTTHGTTIVACWAKLTDNSECSVVVKTPELEAAFPDAPTVEIQTYEEDL